MCCASLVPPLRPSCASLVLRESCGVLCCASLAPLLRCARLALPCAAPFLWRLALREPCAVLRCASLAPLASDLPSGLTPPPSCPHTDIHPLPPSFPLSLCTPPPAPPPPRLTLSFLCPPRSLLRSSGSAVSTAPPSLASSPPGPGIRTRARTHARTRARAHTRTGMAEERAGDKIAGERRWRETEAIG